MTAQEQLDAFERDLDRCNFRLCLKVYAAVCAASLLTFFLIY